MKVVELANSADPDEGAHNEPPRLHLRFTFLSQHTHYDTAWTEYLLFNFDDINVVVCSFAA